MPFTARDVVKNLKKKGFSEDRQRDHIYLSHTHKGLLTGPFTKVSHGSGKEDIGDPLVKKMRAQLHLDTLRQVRELVECAMDKDQYLKHLVKKKVIDP
jgi:predicted RNA binding protein YcfA (HicA-like mRNA interferase family)